MPAVQGAEFIETVRCHQPPTDGLTFWWLGQHSVIVKLAGQTLYFDPYLSPSPRRQTPPLFAPQDVTNADWVLCSHDHGDHVDPYAIQGITHASPQALFVVPAPVVARLIDMGIAEERIVALSSGCKHEEGALCITGVKAAHEFFDYVEGVGYPYLGYVVQAGDISVYHSGDTLCYEGLLTTLRKWKLTVVFLPINGRDAVRYRAGCIGNMTYQEAVDLAGELRPNLVVPTHYDMFANNSVDPALFADYLEAKYPGQAYWLGPPGEAVVVRATPPLS